jgi:hypothetical protein
VFTIGVANTIFVICLASGDEAAGCDGSLGWMDDQF